MTPMTVTETRCNLLWRALWTELDRLENHPDNIPYQTGRENILAEMREIRDMLADINARASIVRAETFAEMLRAYLFESPFTVA